MDRIKINLPENFTFATDIAVRITDLNYGGHVGNDRFLSLIQEARQQYFLHYGYEEMNIEGLGIIITDAAIEFKQQLGYGDIVRIHVTAGGFDKFGFDLFYKMEVIKNDKAIIAGKAKTGILCYDYTNQKMARVPESVKEKLVL
ncbi:MAG TPA: thioesterase family protein [Chitinophagaceae bacterium]|nr:thioesterase family protein [Chitinophagaceae bacterium]